MANVCPVANEPLPLTPIAVCREAEFVRKLTGVLSPPHEPQNQLLSVEEGTAS